jgi:anti-sigma factor RsiW
VERDGGGTCPRSERLPGLLNDHLPQQEAAALRAHLATCQACQADEARLRRLVDTLRRMPPLSAPPGLRERVLAAVEAGDRRRQTVDERGAAPTPARRGTPESVQTPTTPTAGYRLPTILSRLPPSVYRLAVLALLALAFWTGTRYVTSRFQGRTPDEWLEVARQTADRTYLLHVVGWVKTPSGIVPVEAWRMAGSLTTRVGSRAAAIQGDAGLPRILAATWGGAAGWFNYGESLLFLGGPVSPPAGPPRFHSRAPLVVVVPHAGRLVQRVWIDPVSQQVLRVQLIGEDGQPGAALERLEYNQFPAGLYPGRP